MTAQANSNWQQRVRSLLSTGLGVEDIAVSLSCDVQAVRCEVQILRDSKELPDVIAISRAGLRA